MALLQISGPTILGLNGAGPRCRPLAASAPGDRFWQTVTFSVTLTWFSKVMHLPLYDYHQIVVSNGTRITDT